MPDLDPGQLIRETQKLVAESKELHDRSRRAMNESKRLQQRLALPQKLRDGHKP
jgi:hypothetical protein